jgi:hypothetical protein
MQQMSRYNSTSDSEDLSAYQQYCDREDKFKLLAKMIMPPPRGGFTKCIACGAAIAQPYGGQVRRFCDRPGCRKSGSRIMRRFRRWQWERKTRERLRAYWQQQLLPDSQRQLEELLQSRWIVTQPEEGIFYHRSVDIADTVTRMIETEKRSAWRTMERFTVVFEQRAERAEERVKELETELEALRRLLPGALRAEIEAQPRYVNVIDSPTSDDNPRALIVAQQPQQAMPPDPPEEFFVPAAAPEPDEKEDQDRAEVLATLRKAGIPSIDEARAAGELDEDEEEEDETERGDEYDEEEEEE